MKTFRLSTRACEIHGVSQIAESLFVYFDYKASPAYHMHSVGKYQACARPGKYKLSDRSAPQSAANKTLPVIKAAV